MQKKYDHIKLEKKWQKEWEKKPIKAVDGAKGKKSFILVEFPFPSGAGLHTGHVRSYTALDIVARKRRREGQNVLYPIGWDAFGLPTENYAIKTGVQPAIVTKKNTDNFRRQLKALGLSFDWSREINTTDPKYYKWTQWIFLEMYKKGLAYKDRITINWCPKDKIGLANEEVIGGECERCGTKVEKREKEQWMLAITKYADRLDKDLDEVDYLEKIKIQQRNWIGRSEGAEFDFKIKNTDINISVFTTRADTLFGVTYVVFAPESKIITDLESQILNISEVEKYIAEAKKKTEIERTTESKEKTGVELKGVKAINPVNGEEVSVWIADYVLADYGTGAVMAVPAHDERDYSFAKKYNLPIKNVIAPRRIDHKNPHVPGKESGFRKGTITILRNPENGKYLILKWKVQPWTTFITGGIEEGEKPEETALREIREETGYTNVKVVKTVVGPVQSEFFAGHKDVNRIAHTWTILCELTKDSVQEETSDEEKKLHELEWVSKSGLDKIPFNHAEIDLILSNLDNCKAIEEDGILVDSQDFNNLSSEEARQKITENFGKKVVKYKLRDWVFSRQRYWGEPIPMINCEKCGWQAVPEKDLPVVLPKVKKYEPTDTGESPLSLIEKWVKTKCPKCKGSARRETDTMPNWAGSSWYYLRYIDPKNNKAFADPKKIKYWTPVDWYNGGMEHTTLHLLYSRFWHKFLYDIKAVPTKEPYQKRTSHGLILAEGGEKMSKSKGNVVSPDELVKTYGADTLRVYEMFMGPFDQAVAWNSDNMIGPRRFIERVWNLSHRVLKAKTSKKIQDERNILHVLINQTIKKITEDIESLSMNTAVSSLMILLNALEKETVVYQDEFEKFVLLFAPFAPHVSEELWLSMGNKKSVHQSEWPRFDAKKLVSEMVTIAVQINGKTRETISVKAGSTQADVEASAKSQPNVDKWIAGKEVLKVVYVQDRILNIVIRQ